jgi:hypothetical protein
MKWWIRLKGLEASWRADVMWRGSVWSVIVTVIFCALAVLLLALLQLITRGEVRWS